MGVPPGDLRMELFYATAYLPTVEDLVLFFSSVYCFSQIRDMV